MIFWLGRGHRQDSRSGKRACPVTGPHADTGTWGHRRVLWAGRVYLVLVTLAMVGLLARVIQLQTHPPEPITQQVNSQHGRTTLLARRGNLIDRRGRLLATTRLAKRLFVDPALVAEPNTFAERVGYELAYDPAWIAKQIGLRPHRRYVVIDQRLNEPRLTTLKHLRLAGLATQSYAVRDYPQGSLAGQVIGVVGVDDVGLEGLERVLDRRLRGCAGQMGYLRDARLRPLWVETSDYQPPVDGHAVQLSLDIQIQAIAQKHLAQACTDFRAPSGQMIVMDPHTGQILAMANHPSFDPNQLTRSSPDLRRNRCVTDVFEPGSTFKPFVWAVATQDGLAQPQTRIDTTESGVFKTARGRLLHDVRGHGRITWDEVLVHSSNIGMAKVCQHMTSQRMHTAVRAFGFGKVTGSGLPGEVAGIVNPVDRWNYYSVTSVPMGQEIAVTPLQLVTAFSAIANGGYLMTPTVLLPGASGGNADPDTPILERVLDPAVADHTRLVLRRVVVEGTGHRAESRFYTIFGKTGTAQVADRTNGGYLQDQYVSSFLAGAPLERPRVVVICAIHRPDKSLGHHGGTVAAPAVRHVIEQTLAYLGLPPDRPSIASEEWLAGDTPNVYAHP